MVLKSAAKSALFVAAVASLAGCQKRYETPAAALTAARTAMEQGDLGTWVDCYSTKSQSDQVELFLSFIAHAPSQKEEPSSKLSELLRKHGVSDRSLAPGESEEQFAKRTAGQIRNRRAFLIEVVALKKAGKPQRKHPEGELINLQIAGDSAHGEYAINQPDGGTLSQEVHFSKTGGSWRIDSIVGF